AWSATVVAEELTNPGRWAVVACTEGGSTSNEGRLDGEGDGTVDGEGDGTVTGYAVSRVIGDVADLHRIAVDPDYRRKGLARALLDEVRHGARSEGATRLLLEVSAANHGAVAFYAAEGLVEIDRRRGYYRDGSDALVLQGPVGAPAREGTTR
ncbi:MAG: [ribosomal protein S18]-alanine N-acetyltransferase, partial [Nocardioidaceae bacterium]|nr:[ribosomal protein S18]-alanine N-acetyltransferase [Nocardioidaceae bacterium]